MQHLGRSADKQEFLMAFGPAKPDLSLTRDGFFCPKNPGGHLALCCVHGRNAFHQQGAHTGAKVGERSTVPRPEARPALSQPQRSDSRRCPAPPQAPRGSRAGRRRPGAAGRRKEEEEEEEEGRGGGAVSPGNSAGRRQSGGGCQRWEVTRGPALSPHAGRVGAAWRPAWNRCPARRSLTRCKMPTSAPGSFSGERPGESRGEGQRRRCGAGVPAGEEGAGLCPANFTAPSRSGMPSPG